MLAFISLLLAANVAASPLVQVFSACPSHQAIYSALQSYTSATQFCSTLLGITPVSKTVSTTSTSTITATATVGSGTSTSVAAAVTSTITTSTTSTTTAISTVTKTFSASGTGTTVTVIVTTSASAKIAACATGSTTAAARVKRATTISTPSQLSSFNSNQLSAGCSCLHLTTNTVTSTSSLHTTTTTTKSTTILAGTTITTPTSHVTHTVTVISTITSVSTTSTTTGSGNGAGTTTTKTTTVAYSTPTSFFLKANSLYASIANISGGGLYLDSKSSSDADTFEINSSNQLVVTTTGSKNLGYIAVGTPTTAEPTTDWYQIEFTSGGTDGNRKALCCSVTGAGLLTCNYGELFGYCFMGALYEGSQQAPADDYYYDELSCAAVSLSVVTK